MRNLTVERVPCPQCGAPAGQPCQLPSGKLKYDVAHFARREAAMAAGEYEPA